MFVVGSSARQRGYVLTTELLLLATVLVLGLTVGWASIRDAINAELIDTANAIDSYAGYDYFSDPDRSTGGGRATRVMGYSTPDGAEGAGQ